MGCRIKWQPVVLTITTLSKADKQKPDPLASIRGRLESLDIKFAQEFVSTQTTHVVAAKRNVPAVLQGLIFGKYAVAPSYIEAIIDAATEEEAVEGSEPKAPFEKDFDAAWPDPMIFVPAVANEPVARDASYLAPKLERADIFYGYTFVFCLRSQYDALQGVVNAGSGKALLYESFEQGNTSVKDFVAFVKSVAGEKDAGELQDATEGRGVVVVRLTASKDEGSARFIQESAVELNQRSFEQNEFLDTILQNDPSALRRRLAEEIDLTSSAPPTQQMSQARQSKASATPTSSAPAKLEPTSAVRKRTRRPVTQSRFKGFDDSDDEGQEPTKPLRSIDEDEPMQDEPTLPAHRVTPSAQTRPAEKTRKRPTPSPEPEAEDDDDAMDAILPAAAAMKRRRLDENGTAAAVTLTPAKAKVSRRTKPEKDFDVLAEASKRREQQEEAARKDAEALQEAMNGVEIVGPADLVEIKEMKVVPRASVSARSSREPSGNWDEKWNGRKNFKKFQRKGGEQVQRRPKVIVQLEETRKKEFGIGEEYWLEPSAKKKSQRDTQPSQTLRIEPVADDDEDDSRFRRRRRDRQSQNDDVQIISESMPAASISQPTQRQSLATDDNRRPGRKRPAPEPVKEPPAKRGVAGRSTWSRREESEEDEEDDELAFPKAKTRTRKK